MRELLRDGLFDQRHGGVEGFLGWDAGEIEDSMVCCMIWSTSSAAGTTGWKRPFSISRPISRRTGSRPPLPSLPSRQLAG